MKKFLIASSIISSLLLSPVFAYGDHKHDHDTKISVEKRGAYTLSTIEGFNSPESVIVDGKFVFVSSVGVNLAPMDKDGDGYISLLDRKGNILHKDFITGLNAPKGMLAYKGVLYVLDIDTIKGYSIKKQEKVFELEIKDSAFLNAISLVNGKFLVTDTGTGIIHEVDPKTKKYTTFVKIDGKLGGPNGFVYDKKANDLIVAGYDPAGKSKAKIFKVNLKTKKVSEYTDTAGALDGIVYDKNGNLIVSDWGENLNGIIYKIDKKGKVSKLDELKGLKGPAGMFAVDNEIWIPEMANNKVIKVTQ